jgi:membrane protease YdiL (CAAX protease family)
MTESDFSAPDSSAQDSSSPDSTSPDSTATESAATDSGAANSAAIASVASPPGACFLDLGRTGENAWWRYLLGIVLVTVGFTVAAIFWYIVIMLFANHGKVPNLDPITGQPIGVDPMAMYWAINIPAWFVWLFVYLVVRFLHRRPFLSLVTTASSLNWKRFAFGFAAWFCIAAISGIVGWILYPHSYKFAIPGPEYFADLPIVFLMTPIQCTAEELFFRGYLLQALGKAIRNKWFAAAVNGFFFMLPHMWNPEVSYGMIPMALCYFSVGFLLALIVLRTNSLEMAIGAHIANNLFDALILNDVRSVLTTKAIFLCTQAHPWYEASALIVLGAILYGIIDRRLARQAPAGQV